MLKAIRKEDVMKRYTVNQHVAPGIYFCVRRLAFRSMDEAGPLAGPEGDTYVRVPAIAMLVLQIQDVWRSSMRWFLLGQQRSR